MRYRLNFIALFVAVFASTAFLKPSFNSGPGCSGSGCHSLQDGVVTANILDNLRAEITVHGVQPGKKVAGELVDAQGQVVAVNNGTSSNPFILTAPQTGEYRINAGFKSPSRKWDSVMVNLAVTGIPGEKSRVQSSLQLFQNHPNPFNNETVISFTLPVPGNIDLSIYTIDGKLVRTLASGAFREGHHSLRWDGTDESNRLVASGVYIYRLKSGNFTETKRLTLLK